MLNSPGHEPAALVIGPLFAPQPARTRPGITSHRKRMFTVWCPGATTFTTVNSIWLSSFGVPEKLDVKPGREAPSANHAWLDQKPLPSRQSRDIGAFRHQQYPIWTNRRQPTQQFLDFG